MPEQLRAVFVDAGGVLVLPDHDAVVRAFAGASLTVNPGRLDDAHYRAMVPFDAAIADGRDPGPAYRLSYLHALGLADTERAAATAALDGLGAMAGYWTRPIPGARAALAAIREAGLAIVVVSNTDHGDADLQLATAGICQVGAGPAVEVRAIVDSARVGVAKPDPHIFEIALGLSGIDDLAPAEVVHVGDSAAADVAGARRAGIGAIHVDPLGLCGDDAHDHVRALAELPGRLGKKPIAS